MKRQLLIEVDCHINLCGEHQCEYYAYPECRLFDKELDTEKAPSGADTGYFLRCPECKAAEVKEQP